MKSAASTDFATSAFPPFAPSAVLHLASNLTIPKHNISKVFEDYVCFCLANFFYGW